MSFKSKKLSVLVLVFMILSLLVTACGNQKTGAGATDQTQKTIRWKLHLETTDDSPLAIGSRKFAELVKERTGGKYEIDVYPNGQLSSGNQVKALEMLQTGSIDFVWQSGLVQSALEPKLGALSLPWLWKDFATIDKTLDGPTGEKLFQLLNSKGIIGLAWGENGFRELTNNKKEIIKPEDMKDIKFRVIGNKMLIDIFKELGANPVSMNFGELFTALQQGTVDGEENPILSVIIPSRFYEVQKNITLWHYSYDAFLLETNEKVWNSLDAETKKIIKGAAVEAAQYQRKLTRDGTDVAVKFIEEKGMKITRPTSEQLNVFREKVKPVYDQWVPTFGQDLVKELQAANK